jgi:hypothetical protein
MLIAQAEGYHPAKAAQDYHVINNKPAMKTEAMQARFLMAGGRIEWHDNTDKKCSATFSHDAGGKVTITWTIEDAKRIGLTKNATWTNYPRAMLRSRVVSEGVRTVFPVITGGMYTPEEVQDMTPTMIDVTPPNQYEEQWDALSKELLADPNMDLEPYAEVIESMKTDAPKRYDGLQRYLQQHRKVEENV